MHREYNNEISYAKECISKRNKLTFLLKQTEQDLIREKLQFNKLLNELERDNQVILHLEPKNTASLFNAVLGMDGGRFDKVRQEILKTRLKYDQSKNNVSYLVARTKKLVDELALTDSCENEYDELINKKAEHIANADDKDKCEKFKRLLKRKENILSNMKEVANAIIAGQEALDSIENAIEELRNVDNWGLPDSLSDGSADTARRFAEQASRQIGNFKREISKLNLVTVNEISFGDIETFADHFFDSLICDWVLQSGIRRSLDSVKNTKNCIDKAMSKLYEEKVTEEFMYQEAEEQVRELMC